MMMISTHHRHRRHPSTSTSSFLRVAALFLLLLFWKFGAAQEEWEEEEIKERIVKRGFYVGAPLDYSYNDTSDDFPSAPGCPKSVDGYPWVLYGYGRYTRCYLVSQRANVCDSVERGYVMHLHLSDPQRGVCACDFQACLDSWNRQEDIKRTSDSRWEICRPNGVSAWLLDKSDGKCHHEFSQGPCSEWEHLVIVGGSLVECYRRKMLPRNFHSPPHLKRSNNCFGENKVYSRLLRGCVTQFRISGFQVR